MLSYEKRLSLAHEAIDYLMGRSDDEMSQPVPNCPGWTVRNAAVHVGRVGVFWEEMMGCSPNDTEARNRALTTLKNLPEGVATDQLAQWAHSSIDAVSDDASRECYFSITGGPGNAGLWAWHAATEIGVHRLDVEAALGHTPAITAEEAADGVAYACAFFLPAFRNAAGEDPGRVDVGLTDAGSRRAGSQVESDSSAFVSVEGPSVQMLLALFGRPATDVEIVDGDLSVWERWLGLPAENYQFGTWD